MLRQMRGRQQKFEKCCLEISTAPLSERTTRLPAKYHENVAQAAGLSLLDIFCLDAKPKENAKEAEQTKQQRRCILDINRENEMSEEIRQPLRPWTENNSNVKMRGNHRPRIGLYSIEQSAGWFPKASRLSNR